MHSLIEDLSVLTTISRFNLEALASKSVSIISHNIVESMKQYDSITSVDIGIGEILITNVEDKVMYKFIPSKRLEEAVKNTYETGESSLTMEIDEVLGRRITKTYKDLF